MRFTDQREPAVPTFEPARLYGTKVKKSKPPKQKMAPTARARLRLAFRLCTNASAHLHGACPRVGAEDGAAKHPEWELILFIFAFGNQGVVCYVASRFLLLLLLLLEVALISSSTDSSQEASKKARKIKAPHTPKRKRVAPGDRTSLFLSDHALRHPLYGTNTIALPRSLELVGWFVGWAEHSAVQCSATLCALLQHQQSTAAR